MDSQNEDEYEVVQIHASELHPLTLQRVYAELKHCIYGELTKQEPFEIQVAKYIYFGVQTSASRDQATKSITNFPRIHGLNQGSGTLLVLLKNWRKDVVEKEKLALKLATLEARLAKFEGSSLSSTTSSSSSMGSSVPNLPTLEASKDLTSKLPDGISRESPLVTYKYNADPKASSPKEQSEKQSGGIRGQKRKPTAALQGS